MVAKSIANILLFIHKLTDYNLTKETRRQLQYVNVVI